VKTGSAVVPEDVRYTNRIHRDDAAAAIVHLATMEAAPAPAYVGVDDEPAELGSVLRFLAAELGLPEPRVGDAGPARGGNKRCRNHLLRSTGFTFTFPTFREGYRDVIAGNGIRHP
jgi:nucleoside-diphosphate-sugar epimerase